jgi:hypothetical protein
MLATVRSLILLTALIVLAGCADEKAPEQAPAPKGDTTSVPRPDSQSVTLETHPAVMKYDVRSGVVEYFNARLGRRQTYYFDNYGAQEALYITSGTEDSVGVPFDVTIYTGAWRFDYNTRERTGIAKNQPNEPGPVLGLLPNLRTVDISSIASRVVAGKQTTGISYPSNGIVRVWMWRGLPLRVERPLRGGDTLILEATSVTVDEKIPPERFMVPEDVGISRLR